MKAARALAALALAGSLGACAAPKEAAEPPSPPPAAPAGDAPAAGASPGYPGSMTPVPPPAPADAAPKATEPSAEPLWLEFERFDRAVALSTGDCATACRALASLERAAKRVCEGATQLGEGGHCGEATRRLRDARGRVRAACPRCANGTSTEPDAPAP